MPWDTLWGMFFLLCALVSARYALTDWHAGPDEYDRLQWLRREALHWSDRWHAERRGELRALHAGVAVAVLDRLNELAPKRDTEETIAEIARTFDLPLRDYAAFRHGRYIGRLAYCGPVPRYVVGYHVRRRTRAMERQAKAAATC